MAKNKVLVVDDMASVLRFIKFGLEKNHPNVEIFEASNSTEKLFSNLETSSQEEISWI